MKKIAYLISIISFTLLFSSCDLLFSLQDLFDEIGQVHIVEKIVLESNTGVELSTDDETESRILEILANNYALNAVLDDTFDIRLSATQTTYSIDADDQRIKSSELERAIHKMEGESSVLPGEVLFYIEYQGLDFGYLENDNILTFGISVSDFKEAPIEG